MRHTDICCSERMYSREMAGRGAAPSFDVAPLMRIKKTCQVKELLPQPKLHLPTPLRPLSSPFISAMTSSGTTLFSETNYCLVNPYITLNPLLPTPLHPSLPFISAMASSGTTLFSETNCRCWRPNSRWSGVMNTTARHAKPACRKGASLRLRAESCTLQSMQRRLRQRGVGGGHK